MSEKPILFNTEMVRAILNGNKTCTRRVIKPQPDEKHTYLLGFATDSTEKKNVGCFGFGINEYGGSVQYVKPPYGYAPGDILYVRETWCDDRQFTHDSTPGQYFYKASETEKFKWKPSIHMPKEAARIWLKVTDVKVERLQNMTEGDCIKEGIYPSRCKDCNAPFGCDCCPDEGYNEIDAFAELWDSTITEHEKYGFDANPWVWVIEFERCEKPNSIEN